jgi:hypothetical protein
MLKVWDLASLRESVSERASRSLAIDLGIAAAAHAARARDAGSRLDARRAAFC